MYSHNSFLNPLMNEYEGDVVGLVEQPSVNVSAAITPRVTAYYLLILPYE